MVGSCYPLPISQTPMANEPATLSLEIVNDDDAMRMKTRFKLMQLKSTWMESVPNW